MSQLCGRIPTAIVLALALGGCGLDFCDFDIGPSAAGPIDVAANELRESCPNVENYYAAEGACGESGPRFLFVFSGFGVLIQVDYYDRSTGEYLGSKRQNTTTTPSCPGRYFYEPAPVPCESPAITEVLCGTGPGYSDWALSLAEELETEDASPGAP